MNYVGARLKPQQLRCLWLTPSALCSPFEERNLKNGHSLWTCPWQTGCSSETLDLRLKVNWNNPKLPIEKHHGTVIQDLMLFIL